MREIRRAALAVSSAAFVMLAAASCRTRVTVPPPPPASVSAQALPGGILVDWTDVGAPRYEVLLGTGATLSVAASVTMPFVRIRHLAPDRVYRVEVRPAGGDATTPIAVEPLPWLDGAPLWVVPGLPGGGLGSSISAIDENQDGRIDLLAAGEPFAGSGQLDDFFIDESGLFGTTPNPGIAPVSQPGAEAGFSGAGAGTVLAIGIPGADGTVAGEGQVVVIGVDGTAYTMSAPVSVAAGAFGEAMASGNFVETTTACFAFAEPGAGRVFVVSTSLSTLATFTGSASDHAGAAVETFPAPDRESVDRLAIGEPLFAGGAGEVQIESFSGGTPLSLWSASGGAGEELGSVLATGDVDGDGYPELLAGGACGKPARVFTGGPNLPSTTPAAMLSGPGCFGRAFAAFDPATDGEPLLVVGDPSMSSAPGSIRIYDGTDLAAGPVWIQTGGSPAFGSALVGGNLADDGHQMLVVGDPGDPADPLAIGQLELFRRRRDHGPRANAGFPMNAPAGQPVSPVLPTFDDPDLTFSSWTCTWTWDATLGTAGQTVISGCTTGNVGATSFIYTTSGERPVVLRVTNDLDGRWGEALVEALISGG